MRRKRVWLWVLLGAAFLWAGRSGKIPAAEQIWKLLRPFLVGGCFAVLLNVPLKFLEKRILLGKKGQRAICLALSFLLLGGAAAGLGAAVIPPLKKSGVTLMESLPGYRETLEGWVSGGLERMGMKQLEEGWDALFSEGSILIEKAMGSAAAMAGGLAERLFSLGVGLVFSGYLLAKKEGLCRGIRRVLLAFLEREEAEYLIRVGQEIARSFSAFVTGQLAEAAILGGLCFLGMALFRMPYAALVSTVVGVTALVPVFGAFAGGALGGLLLFLAEPKAAVWFLVFLILLQQVETNFIYPKVVGGSVGLPGIWVLAAVAIGGSAFGAAGVFLGIPLAAAGYGLFREEVERRLGGKADDPGKKP